MKDEICKHCGLPIKIGANNPICDHLYYPENCDTCKNAGKLKSKIAEKDKQYYWDKTDKLIQIQKYQRTIIALSENGNLYEYCYDKKKKYHFWKLRIGSPQTIPVHRKVT